MAVGRVRAPVRPRWPAQPFDLTRGLVSYSDLAYELVVYFGERPVASFVDFIDAPGLPDAAVVIPEDSGGEEMGEVVGAQVDLLRARAAKVRPARAVLAGPSPPPQAVAALVEDVAELFERYWTPVPPMEERFELGADEGREDLAGR